MGEIIGYLLGALIPFIMWFFDRKTQKKKRDLEIKKVTLEVDRLTQDKKEIQEKLQYLDRMLDLEFITNLYDAVNNIFDNTKADRFLILLAKNGKTDFKVVNVVFEHHKDNKFKINAVATYRNIEIDLCYREMLKEAEFRGVIELETAKMDNCLLKSFYENEGVKFSKIRHLSRQPIDSENDFLLFSSLATHEDENFTENEMAHIKTQYEGIILPSLYHVMT